MNIIKNLTWLELLSLLVTLRIVFIAVKNGILCEFFKISAVFFSSFFALQYYPVLLERVQSNLFQLKKEVGALLWGVIIFFLVYVAFSFLRNIVLMLFKQEEVSRLQRWLSLPVGLVRATLIMSLLTFAVSLVAGDSRIPQGSLTVRISRNVAGKCYLGMFPLYKKVVPGSVMNKEVKKYHEAEEDL